ncbi:MAG TPA: GntR family transcriptional regulator [Anaerolineaceae bacterium]|nr:GntR family transcriptional regulator [Anaerolineaceae bacterium]HPN53615.1 GntR family transcriptional regulator [Anaerolineaceae bacterium]
MVHWEKLIIVDKLSHVPLYVQIVESITQLIEDGQLRNGDLLPSETEFCRILGVSRLTIRQAFDRLEHSGLIKRQHGVGTFVAYKPSTAITPGRLSFTNKMKQLGKTVRSQVLSIEHVAANEEVAENLRIPTGAQVIRLARLRFADEAPVMVEHSFLPVELFPDLVEAFPQNSSLYQFLQTHYNTRVLSVEQTWQPVQLTGEQADLLEEKPGALGILTKLVACTTREKPVEYSWSVVSSSKCLYYFRFREEEPEN